MEWIFWASIAIVVYVYVGYPVLVALAARLFGRGGRTSGALEAAAAPAVSIVIAVRNEAQRLPARMRNLIDLDYDGPLQIIVVSDGSTDDPAAALEPWADRVDLVEAPAAGKAAALNAGAASARHDILVFADARQLFAPDALRRLVAPFADRRVGGVSGELLLDGDHDSSVGEGVGLYWRYEKWLRRSESAIGSTLGATGAIYALRRSLWRPLPSGTLLDDVLAPMRAVLAGARVVMEPAARAFDRVPPDAATEWRRKVRTLAGNYQILRLEPRLLLPVVNPVWWQYVSHKLGRLVVPYALIGALVASMSLAASSPLYAAAFAVQCLFYGLAAAVAVGGLAPRPRDLIDRTGRVAFAFVMMNYAAVAGLVALARGRQVWR